MPRFLALLAVLLMSADSPLLAQSPQAGYERSGSMRNQSRSVVMAKNGIVATSHPLAAQAGLDMLQAGGSAADAAIAANAMLGVVEPMSCGIGGDLFVIYWDNKTQRLYGLNGSGRSPYNISRQKLKDKELDEIPSSGPLSWSVPGCVDGWEELRAKFGRKTLAESLQAAITTADEGFPVSEVIAAGWKGSVPNLKDWPDSVATYLINGERAPVVGEVFRNPNMAESYRKIAKQGRDAFYKGDIAREIVSFSEKVGGYFSLKDFADHTSTWIEPVSTNYRGYDVWELPPNGQGIAALQMLNLLEPYDLRKLGHNSAETLHLLLEAKKLAFADRAKYYADPDFVKLPTAELISKEYARERAKLLNRTKALDDVPAGNPRLETCDTIYLTVVDKDRNCCSFMQSIYHGFGSQVVAGKTGFALQSRGCLFALDDKHLNRLEPHKRPFHTIIPAMVTKGGKPWLCYGVMGGDMQAQGHVQILLNMIDFDLNVQAAGDAARVLHTGSATPTGDPAVGSGTVHVEGGVSDETMAALRAKGHKVVRSRGGYGGYQGILIDWQNGVLHGGTEPRKDGAAVGY